MTEVKDARPFDGDCTEGLKAGCENLGELTASVPDSKLINNRTEEDGTSVKRL
jgi:hypothetical protein